MKHSKLVVALLAVLFTSTVITSCRQGGAGTSTSNDSTKVEVDSASLPELKGDASINKATKFYAGISKEGINMSATDAESWDKYSKEINRLLTISKTTRVLVDSLVKTDFADFRDKIDMVFYPFSGADFLYPITIFPNADTYVLCGLEKIGTPINTDIKTNSAYYQSYRKALSTFLNLSYFITKDMVNDMNNNELDGTCPVISMLMATDGYEIISIKNKKVAEGGQLVDAEGMGNVMEYKFFRKGSKHEQTLYYVSADLEDKRKDENVYKFFANNFKDHTVASYLKAASYLMTQSNFSIICETIVNNSQYIVEDDSGVPYKYLTDKFDVTLYGMYKRPLPVFTSSCIQPELDQAYKDNADKVKKLPFRIGYNNPSNWQCARRKSGK